MTQHPLFDANALVTARNKAYGDAWVKTSEIMSTLGLESSLLWATRFSFPWIMILNKLIRAMTSPNEADHWRDIQGYAQLVLNVLTEPKQLSFDFLQEK